MLIRHFFLYFLARGLPGLVNFGALAIYTRLLTAEEFGRYSLVVAGVGLAHVIVFQWLLLVLGRFFPAHANAPRTILQPLLALFLFLAACVVFLALALGFLSREPFGYFLMLLAASLVVTQAWHELNLRLATAELAPRRYGALSGAKSALAILIGGTLAVLGFGANAPVFGLVVGSLLACWLFARGSWHEMRPRWPERKLLRAFGGYGLPLTVTFALVWITSSSDRLIIGWLLGEAATAVYAVGYDLAQQSLGLLLVIVNTAAFPLAIKKLEQQGVQAASEQMRQNGELIFVLAFAGAAGLIALGPAMVEAFIGQAFRAGALLVFPWVALVAAVVGIKSFHFDLAFHLSKKSKWLIVTSGLAAISNIALNIILIPRFGIVGAAWAGIVAFTVATICSAILGARVFPMPPVAPLFFRAIFVASFSYFAARYVMGWPVSIWTRLALSLFFGAGVAIIASILVNVANSRSLIVCKCKIFFRLPRCD